MNLKKTIVQNFICYYRNEEEFRKVYGEIFENEGLLFSCADKRPLILDCGSHIGLATLYFKMRCPDAEIIAFEPDPNNCEIFRKNIEANNLRNITIINAAVAHFEGKAKYYGEIEGESPDTRGNSIVEAWGNRGLGNIILVDAVRLSSYIKAPVDFLKIDIEGAEGHVLNDIEDHLKYIKELHLEFHQTDIGADKVELKWIIALLEKHSFEMRVIHTNLQSFLPEKLKNWVRTANPNLTIVRATNLSPIK